MPTFEPLDHVTHPNSIATLLRLVNELSPFEGASLSIVEVGVWAGMTTIELAKLGHTVYAVDHWMGNPDDRLGELAMIHGSDKAFRVFCQNLRSWLFHEVFPCRGTSELWASVWPRPVDLVFIDADHRYESVKRDIEAWSPHVRPGGILCGHDYPEFDGVVRAVDEAFPEVEHENSVWWRKM